MTVTFSPREGATLVAWSIPTGIKITGEWKGRPFYYLHITRAEIKSDYQLQLTFNVSLLRNHIFTFTVFMTAVIVPNFSKL